MKIGVSCLEYSHLSFEKAISKIKNLGVNYVEVGSRLNGISFENLASVNSILEKNEMQVAALNIDNLINVEDKIKLAKLINAKYLIIGRNLNIETNESKRDALYNFIELLKNIVKKAEKENLVILIENQTLGIIMRPKGLLEIVSNINSPFLKIVYDPDNFYNAGEEPFPYAYRLLDNYIGYIHAKDSTEFDKNIFDYNVRILHRAGKDVVCVSLGQGALNWEGIINELKKVRYKGFIILEPHTQIGLIDKTISESLQYLKMKNIDKLEKNEVK
jgi:sugar phosphate isomerase/epimerase